MSLFRRSPKCLLEILLLAAFASSEWVALAGAATLVGGCLKEDNPPEASETPAGTGTTTGTEASIGSDASTSSEMTSSTEMTGSTDMAASTETSTSTEIVPTEMEETYPSIAGAWQAGGIDYKYVIVQTGRNFTWAVTNQPALGEQGKGEFTSALGVKASWTNNNGGGSAEGEVVLNGDGAATWITWTNGIIFSRD